MLIGLLADSNNFQTVKIDFHDVKIDFQALKITLWTCSLQEKDVLLQERGDVSKYNQ